PIMEPDSRQAKPPFISCPGNRLAFSNNIRNSRQRLSPPAGLAHDPRTPPFACITKLRENAPGKHGKVKRERTSHPSDPELVARMTIMNAKMIARPTGVMMTNGDDRREKHVISSGYTL